MRPYEKLKTIYEIASRMIVRGEGAWKDYLSFAARIHKYSFDMKFEGTQNGKVANYITVTDCVFGKTRTAIKQFDANQYNSYTEVFN